METLAIVKAIERFHVYVQGIKFKIVTDCNSLVLAMKKININRIARWSLYLQNYQYELIHRTLNKMIHVDCLSRNVMLTNNIFIEDEILYKQLADTKIKEIAIDLEHRNNKYFASVDGLVFRNYKDRQLFVVPDNMVNNIIRIHHDKMGHIGIDKTIQSILKHYWFACMKVRVKQYLDNCVKCLSNSIAAGKQEGEMEIIDITPVPMYTLHADHFGLLQETPKKKKICISNYRRVYQICLAISM